ncbi:MAG: hypothetical protein AAB693_00690 [Patescibacteria group bacterium]
MIKAFSKVSIARNIESISSLKEVKKLSTKDGYCVVNANAWAVAFSLTLDPTKSWCVDNAGAAREVSVTSEIKDAIDTARVACNF